jgi:hypothetical protein
MSAKSIDESMTDCLADEPAKYRILVKGRLQPQWATRLGDMTLTVQEGDGQAVVTDLTGWIGDQAALMGVLGQLYALGVTVLSVERLKADVDPKGTPA